MEPALLDLFGDIPVSLEEIEIWLDTVPRFSRDSPRRKHYALYWNIPEKIKAAKRDGKFPLS